MLLKTLTISGYRSITESITLQLDPTVTVLLGANDQGKTNILRAIEHLNVEKSFSDPSDLSWDREGDSAAPLVEFLFELTDDERVGLANAIVDAVSVENDEETEESDDDESANEEEGEEDDVDSSSDQDDADRLMAQESSSPPPQAGQSQGQPLSLKEALATVPKTIVVRRSGLGGGLKYFDAKTGVELDDVVQDFTPFVQLIEPISNVADSVTAAEIRNRDGGFMRGIFWYAGLDPDASTDLFTQTPKTVRRLHDASIELNRTIKASWSQGKDLDFILQHNSAKKSIDLMIKDPSVGTRYVSASQRSAGFTQFFTIKTILYARQREHASRSYILLFDEPGIYLHPSGQQDLLQVIESLAKTHQTVYVTHSLFMINKSYPIRHRLVTKTGSGTRLEGKPYVGRWARALSALGMSFSGTILFASHVLLTEGDSDPIYINAMLQKMIEVGKLKVDLNAFAAIASGQSADADALIRILFESEPYPRAGLLVDGDRGGKDRVAHLNPVLKRFDIAARTLGEGTTIEDHLPNVDLLLDAVCIYLEKLIVDAGRKTEADAVIAAVRDSFTQKFGEAGASKGIALWIKTDLPRLAGLNSSPSKVGIAREYATLLQDLAHAAFRVGSRAPHLAKWIVESLKLPCMGTDESKVLDDAE